jgi:hypothetical protein
MLRPQRLLATSARVGLRRVASRPRRANPLGGSATALAYLLDRQQRSRAGELLLEHAYTCKLLALDDVVDLEQVWLARLDPDIGEYRHQLLAKGLPLLS